MLESAYKFHIIKPLFFFQDTARHKLCNKDDLSLIGERTLCRVLLSNQSTSVVPIKESETIQDLINRVLDKRGIAYKCFEVYLNNHSKVNKM